MDRLLNPSDRGSGTAVVVGGVFTINVVSKRTSYPYAGLCSRPSSASRGCTPAGCCPNGRRCTAASRRAKWQRGARTRRCRAQTGRLSGASSCAQTQRVNSNLYYRTQLHVEHHWINNRPQRRMQTRTRQGPPTWRTRTTHVADKDHPRSRQGPPMW